jgi:hypothetical protein
MFQACSSTVEEHNDDHSDRRDPDVTPLPATPERSETSRVMPDRAIHKAPFTKRHSQSAIHEADPRSIE